MRALCEATETKYKEHFSKIQLHGILETWEVEAEIGTVTAWAWGWKEIFK